MSDQAPFIESGMTFGPFPPGRVFRIEHSQVYRQVSKGESGAKVAEILLLRDPPANATTQTIWIIEAKSSSPRPESESHFDKFIEEIRRKLTDSLSLLFAIYLGRHPDAIHALPEPFQRVDPAVIDIQLVLIIKGHRRDWLSPLNEKLTRALKPAIRIWSLQPTAVTVLNDDQARKYGVIS